MPSTRSAREPSPRGHPARRSGPQTRRLISANDCTESRGIRAAEHLGEVAMGLQTYGVMGVDWEERVRLDRLREERLARISSLLAESEMAGLLCFDMANIRYVTATHIGTWAQDKLNRFCLLPRAAEPI